MKTTPHLRSGQEIDDILEAAEDSLLFALEHGQLLKRGYDPVGEALNASRSALRSIRAARSKDSSPLSIKGHVANAAARLRSAIRAIPVKQPDNPPRPERTAMERSLALLLPITRRGDSAEKVRKTRRASRRRFQTTSGAGRRPRFWVSVHEGGFTNFFTGLERDIDTGGLFIATYNIYPVGAEMDVKVELPSGDNLVSRARVAWVREQTGPSSNTTPGMGVIFHRLTPAAKTEINRYIEKFDSLYYEVG